MKIGFELYEWTEEHARSLRISVGDIIETKSGERNVCEIRRSYFEDRLNVFRKSEFWNTDSSLIITYNIRFYGWYRLTD